MLSPPGRAVCVPAARVPRRKRGRLLPRGRVGASGPERSRPLVGDRTLAAPVRRPAPGRRTRRISGSRSTRRFHKHGCLVRDGGFALAPVPVLATPTASAPLRFAEIQRDALRGAESGTKSSTKFTICCRKSQRRSRQKSMYAGLFPERSGVGVEPTHRMGYTGFAGSLGPVPIPVPSLNVDEQGVLKGCL
jgi:hypothetical protein